MMSKPGSINIKMLLSYFLHGDLIIKRIRKIAESLDANLYDVDSSNEGRSQQLAKVNKNLSDLYTVLKTTSTTLESELYAIAKELDSWFQDVTREKAIFEILNKSNDDTNRKILIAEGWIPRDELATLQARLGEMIARLGIDVPIHYPSPGYKPHSTYLPQN